MSATPIPRWVTDFHAAVAEAIRQRAVETYRRDSLVVETARQIVSERITIVQQVERYEGGCDE